MRFLACTSRSLLGLLLLVPCIGGCRAACVDRAAVLYADGDYVGAAEVFEHNESRFESASPREQARYALYRGITLQSLGDVKRAEYWLKIASGVFEREPDALDDGERLH